MQARMKIYSSYQELHDEIETAQLLPEMGGAYSYDHADYLAELAGAAGLPVKLRTEVVRVAPVDGFFDVHVRTGCAGGLQTEEKLCAPFVVWAAGEFQYPRECACGIDGAELCVHNSSVRSWAELQGDGFVVIGGYESGVDAAVNLANAGKQSTVLASTATSRSCTRYDAHDVPPVALSSTTKVLDHPSSPSNRESAKPSNGSTLVSRIPPKLWW